MNAAGPGAAHESTEVERLAATLDGMLVGPARFEAVLRAATEYSIIGTDLAGTIAVFNIGAERMLGYRAREVVGRATPLLIHDPAEVAARAAALGVAPGFDALVADARRGHAETRDWTYIRKDGARLPVSLTVTAMRDESGTLAGFIGIARDLTEYRRVEAERRRADEEVALLHTVLVAVGQAEDLPAALEVVLKQVCAATGWAVGQAWVPIADGSEMACSRALCIRVSEEAARPFRRASEALRVRPGQGLLGGVWQTRHTAWVPDLQAEPSSLRRDEARAAGLRAWLGVPVLGGTQAGADVVAILEFLLDERRDEEDRLLRMVGSVAAQLGMVIERKRFETQYRDFVESAPDSVVVADASGRIVLVNRHLEQTFGYRREELLSQPIEVLVPERFRAVHPLHRSRFAAAPSGRSMGIGLEVSGRRKDGSEFPAEISLSPVQTDGRTLITAVIRDITARKQAEAERALLLAREAAARVEAEQLKDEFIANVSHDLRTPVATIKAAIGVVLANEPPGIPEPLHRMLVNIDLATDHIARLVADLLELTRLQAGRVPLEAGRCDLRAIARRATREVEPLAHTRGQRIELVLPRRPVWALVDAERIERVLLNLLSNAHRYSVAGDVFRLEVVRRTDELLASVTDHGPGIPKADHQRIFERFYRSETLATLQAQGSGLGLAITRAIVELHGGRIWVESEPGTGTTFWIALPAPGASTRMRPAAAAAAEAPVPADAE